MSALYPHVSVTIPLISACSSRGAGARGAEEQLQVGSGGFQTKGVNS